MEIFGSSIKLVSEDDIQHKFRGILCVLCASVVTKTIENTEVQRENYEWRGCCPDRDTKSGKNEDQYGYWGLK